MAKALKIRGFFHGKVLLMDNDVNKEQLASAYLTLTILNWPIIVFGTMISLIGFGVCFLHFNWGYVLIKIGQVLAYTGAIGSLINAYFRIRLYLRNKRKRA